MSAAMRSFDWESTPLGAPQCWPEGLKIPVRMMLLSRFEMWLGWGTELTFFYNDAYIPTLGAKHPGALGRPMRRVWNEVFADVEDRITSVMRDSVATWDKALLLVLERNGYKEETYHTFSYSPLRGDTGLTEGLICVVTEETERVIGERRLETLSTLASSLLAIRTREEIKFHASRAARSAGPHGRRTGRSSAARRTRPADPGRPWSPGTRRSACTEPPACRLAGNTFGDRSQRLTVSTARQERHHPGHYAPSCLGKLPRSVRYAR